ncbi:MAG TPA: biopolymer transporter ExbD [Candidatus Baltobacteraceae bacterium]|jgi:biopolymer transport protein ExbD|nr:biopolymer transporter ExbD [Candidatus Baltobacteraceae bacterium]
MSLISARQDDEVMAEINITPFTDVLLVLLIIFILLAALVTPPGFQKQLPNKSDAAVRPPPKPQKSIEVQVSRQGAIFVDEQRTDERGIYAVMAAVEHQRGLLHVSITADADVHYDVIIKILDAARLAGLEDVGFVTS